MKRKQQFLGYAIASFLNRKITLKLRKQRHHVLLDQPGVKAQFDKRSEGAQHLPVRRSGRHALQRIVLDVITVAKDLVKPAADVVAKKRETVLKFLVQNRARRVKPTAPSNRAKKRALMEAARSYGWRGHSYRKALRFEMRMQHGKVYLSGPKRGQLIPQ